MKQTFKAMLAAYKMTLEMRSPRVGWILFAVWTYFFCWDVVVHDWAWCVIDALLGIEQLYTITRGVK